MNFMVSSKVKVISFHRTYFKIVLFPLHTYNLWIRQRNLAEIEAKRDFHKINPLLFQDSNIP